MLRVLSYNIQFGRKWKILFPWLAKQKNVDVFCLQEFPENKIDEFQNMFPHYQFVFTPSLRVLKKTYGVLTLTRLKCTKKIHIAIGKTNTVYATEFVYRHQHVLLVNLHLTFFSTNKQRYAQIKKILDSVISHRIPTVLIGDFNIPSFVVNNKLIAYMRDRKFETFEKRMVTHRLTRVQLDYAFVKNGEIKNIAIERVSFSDHYPIKIEVTL